MKSPSELKLSIDLAFSHVVMAEVKRKVVNALFLPETRDDGRSRLFSKQYRAGADGGGLPGVATSSYRTGAVRHPSTRHLRVL